MKSRMNGGTVVTLLGLGILLASVITAGILNRVNSGKNPSITQNTSSSPAPTSQAPYYVRITLNKSFTQEIHFTADGKQRISYQVDGGNWVVDLETHRKTNTSVQVNVHAERFVKQKNTSGEMSTLGFFNILTLDAPPMVYPDDTHIPHLKTDHLSSKIKLPNIQMPTCAVSVSSKPTITVQSHTTGMAMR